MAVAMAKRKELRLVAFLSRAGCPSWSEAGASGSRGRLHFFPRSRLKQTPKGASEFFLSRLREARLPAAPRPARNFNLIFFLLLCPPPPLSALEFFLLTSWELPIRQRHSNGTRPVPSKGLLSLTMRGHQNPCPPVGLTHGRGSQTDEGLGDTWNILMIVGSV